MEGEAYGLDCMGGDLLNEVVTGRAGEDAGAVMAVMT